MRFILILLVVHCLSPVFAQAGREADQIREKLAQNELLMKEHNETLNQPEGLNLKLRVQLSNTVVKLRRENQELLLRLNELEGEKSSSPEGEEDLELKAAIEASLKISQKQGISADSKNYVGLDERVPYSRVLGGAFGLINFNHTSCFMNSVLNAILSIEGIESIVEQSLPKSNPQIQKIKKAFLNLSKVRTENLITLSKNISHGILTPFTYPHAAGYESQLRELIRAIEEERYSDFTKRAADRSVPDFKEKSFFLKEDDEKKYLGSHQIDAHEFVSYLFPRLTEHSQLAGFYEGNHIRYSSGNDKLSSDSSSEKSMTLAVAVNSEITRISDAIRVYFQPESVGLSDGLFNEETKEKEAFSKQTLLLVDDIQNIPHQLFVSVKRYVQDGNQYLKYTGPVSVDDITLTFYPKGSHGLSESVSRKYRPLGVINHKGKTPESGHYYFLWLDPKGMLLINDSQASHEFKVQDAQQDLANLAYTILYSDR